MMKPDMNGAGGMMVAVIVSAGLGAGMMGCSENEAGGDASGAGTAGSAGPAGPAQSAEPSAKSETPTDAIRAIIALYEAGDFSALVRTRYAEIDKAEGEAQVQMLVDRFASRFADASAVASAVATYEAAMTVEPIFSEEGRVATFSLEDGFVMLSRMADGRWGFHL